MAAATLMRARSLLFRLAPDDHVDFTKAIGAPITGKGLDARLKRAMSGKEKSTPVSVAVKETRKRLSL